MGAPDSVSRGSVVKMPPYLKLQVDHRTRHNRQAVFRHNGRMSAAGALRWRSRQKPRFLAAVERDVR